MDHVEAFTKEHDPCEQECERQCDHVLHEMASDPSEGRKRIPVDADALYALVTPGRALLGTDYRHVITGLGHGERLHPNAAIRRHGAVLDQEQDLAPGGGDALFHRRSVGVLWE